MWHEEQLFIGGELRDARNGSTFENINPATEELLGVSADANEEDFDNAIAAARAAFDAGQWSTDLDFACIVWISFIRLLSTMSRN